MRRQLLISAGPGEWRAALLEKGATVELYVERGDCPPAGSIHLGRVVRRTPGLDAVLVDIETDRPGFLPVRDAPPNLRLDEGARVIVQVRREALPDKGARLSARINPRRGGPDLEQLSAAVAQFEPPRQLDPPLGFANTLALRLPATPEQILADHTGLIPELRGAFPNSEVAYRPPEEWPIHLDAEFAAALASSLALPDGGAVHIAETAAAVLIDIDTGVPDESSRERGALAANLAAVDAIARQIRLRQLGGGIIIDFVGLEGRGAREQVREAMIRVVTDDPAEPQVLGWTRLGHLEIVRPRHGRSLGQVMLQAQGVEKSGVTVAFEALRLLQREARIAPAADWRLVVCGPVAAALRGRAAAALHDLEARLGREIAIEVKEGRDHPAFDIVQR